MSYKLWDLLEFVQHFRIARPALPLLGPCGKISARAPRVRTPPLGERAKPDLFPAPLARRRSSWKYQFM